MSLYIDTTGNSNVGIGICARCSLKFALVDLSPDPNYPGLMVCVDDKDLYDPYRLPARSPENIVLTMPRPDDKIVTISVAPGSPAWPASSFPDDGLGAGQLPTTGNSS